MERDIQHKLLHYETAPPEGLWMNIARQLDLLTEQHISNALLQHEEPAPPAAWNNIALQLDQLSEQHIAASLLQYEAEAPANAWPQIAASLDALAEKQVAEKLLQYEVAPPSIIWSKINEQLDAAQPAQEPAKVIAIPRRNIIRIAAAAAVVAAIVTGGVIYFNAAQDNNSNNIAAKPAVNTTTPNAPVNPANTIAVEEIAAIAEATTQPARSPRKQIAASSRQFSEKNNDEAFSFLPPPDNSSVQLLRTDLSSKIEWLKNSRGLIENDINAYNAGGAYEIIAGPNGMPVRVSQKVASLFRMISNAENPYKEEIDLIIEQSAFWKKKFSQWKEAAANPATITGVFDLPETTKEQ
jgi:hypothetical protein